MTIVPSEGAATEQNEPTSMPRLYSQQRTGWHIWSKHKGHAVSLALADVQLCKAHNIRASKCGVLGLAASSSADCHFPNQPSLAVSSPSVYDSLCAL